MDKFELEELRELLEKFHSDKQIMNIVGFHTEEDNIISNAIDVIYDVLEKI